MALSYATWVVSFAWLNTDSVTVVAADAVDECHYWRRNFFLHPRWKSSWHHHYHRRCIPQSPPIRLHSKGLVWPMPLSLLPSPLLSLLAADTTTAAAATTITAAAVMSPARNPTRHGRVVRRLGLWMEAHAIGG